MRKYVFIFKCHQILLSLEKVCLPLYGVKNNKPIPDVKVKLYKTPDILRVGGGAFLDLTTTVSRMDLWAASRKKGP